MRDAKLVGLTLAAMALLPGLAAATHFDEVIVVGDCEGWSAEVNVTWRTGIYTGDLNYSIRLVDQNANILEQIDWAGVIDREVSDPRQMVYNFSGTWSGTYSGPQFTVVGMFHLVAPYPGGVDDDTANVTTTFECTVAAENATWSSIKTLYR